MLHHHYRNSSQLTVMINNHSNDLLRADAGCAKPCHPIWRWTSQCGILEGEYVLVFTVWKGGLHFTALQLLNMQNTQVKYRIEACEKIAAAAGVYGDAVAKDTTFNSFVNDMGCRNTNKPLDIKVGLVLSIFL